MKPGQLVVATPLMDDPNFVRAVICLFAMDDGAAGVVLNRPSELPVATALPRWAGAAAPPAVVHVGGPVAVERAVALGRPQVGEAIGSALSIIDLEGPMQQIATGSIRVFAGYAGWSQGQLEAELEAMAWFLVDGSIGDILDPDPTTLWRRVLARQGPELSRFALYPDDPGLN